LRIDALKAARVSAQSLCLKRITMPQTNADQARELAKNCSDCSFLLTHLIRQNDGKSNSQANDILKSILALEDLEQKATIRSSVVGWYGTSTPNVFNPCTGRLDGEIRNKASCFTESTLAGLRAHRDLFQVKYGLAFDRDFLFSKGANPCLNISNTLLRESQDWHENEYSKYLYNFIPSSLHPFVNVIHGQFDATHEREWRYPGDLNFLWQELKFVFCPESEFNVFSQIQKDAMPCLFDLAWLDRI